MKTILVQMSHRQWTLPALHLACALARNTQAKITLLHLMTVKHPSYLGTPFGITPLTAQQQMDLKEYNATAEDYGIVLTIQPMQCLTPIGALLEAARILEADALFADVTESPWPLWQKMKLWLLRRRLAPCQLFVIDKVSQSMERLPSIVVKPTYNLKYR